MWLQALFTADDLLRALSRVTPARIPLAKEDPERCLWLSKPDSVLLRDDKDIVITTRAQVRWDVLGLTVPVTLQSVTVVLSPEVQDERGAQALSFGLRIQEADLSAVPAFVEGSLVARVNEALAEADGKMSWRFLETLDFAFHLPMIEPRRKMKLWARSGTAKVTSEGLSLMVGWELDSESVEPEAEPLAPAPVA
jgi:hypothetical protein